MSAKRYRNFGKRLLDLALVIPALILLSPLFALLALLVRFRLGSPVLFRQVRPGKNGKLFAMYKFRTMLDLCDQDGRLLPDENRVTPFGRVLRRTSLDELPQLWNVLRGEMSLVGPRPLLVRYLERYTPKQARRHEVLPGIAGWAQMNGRNTVEWDKRLAMDVWYVDNLSLWLDFKIIAMTFLKVLLRAGTVEEGEFPDFWGTHGPPPGRRLVYPADQGETRHTSTGGVS
jgi:lipopolysaccharide/colanic/teichoic acid biosynthesis glycosyltransferase